MITQKAKKRFSKDHLNAWRMHRQCLDRPYKGKDLLALIRRIGWIYSPGCSTPYLSLWARTPKFLPEGLDGMVFKEQQLVQLETLRGCTMLVPRDQAPVALRVRSRTFTELSRQARSLIPMTDREMELLKSSILDAVAGGSKTYDEILEAVPDGLVRAFPPNLKRIGLTGSLWLGINLLKEDGRILKLQTTGRLDTTEYAFALLSDLLPETDPFELKTEQASVELAAQYFRTEGPARVRDFAWWAGINVTAAMRAASQATPRLESVEVADSRDEYLMSSVDLEEFMDFIPSKAPAVNFIPFRDIYLKGQREVVDRFVRSEDAGKPFSRWKGKVINDPLATVLLDGEVAGVWEWDGARGIDFLLFDEAIGDAARTLVERRAADLGDFIREHLGEVRLQGGNYGKHQMTRIRELEACWG